jgi:hypothetical protein
MNSIRAISLSALVVFVIVILLMSAFSTIAFAGTMSTRNVSSSVSSPGGVTRIHADKASVVSSSLSSSVNNSSIGLADAVTSMGYNSTTGAAINRTSLFSVGDNEVVSYLNITNISSPSHNVTWFWLAPSGSVYYNGTLTIPDPGAGKTWTYYTSLSTISVSGHEAATLPGKWSIAIYFDNTWLINQTFTINPSSSIPTPRLTIGGSALAINVSSVTNSTSNRSVYYSTNSSSVYSWLNFTNVPSPTHNVTFVWLTPQRTLYFNTSYIIPSPSSGPWSNVAVWSGIFISGQKASRLTGLWMVEVYVDGSILLTQPFVIEPP